MKRERPARLDGERVRVPRPRCAVPDAAHGERCAWARRRVAFCLDWRGAGIGRIGAATCLALYREAVSTWASASGLDLVVVERAESADVVTGLGPIDGPGYTLAWSELPCGPDHRLRQRFGSAERIRRKVELLNLFLHEHGHALGLEHGPAGSVMQPWADGALTTLTAWDLAELEARYGRHGR